MFERPSGHDLNLVGIRVNESRPSVQVDEWSAGCRVLQDPDHFDFPMTLCERQREKFRNGDSFSYTLLREQDFG